MARILLTGGCGHVGSVLVPKLLAAGHLVRVIDCQWFGSYLEPHENLRVIKGDIREPFPIGGCDSIIHLAAVANDPCGELDPKLTWEINALATMQLADRAVREGVKQFIYASSGSVYGVSDWAEVYEEVPLHPLSEYNKTKMVAERCLLSYSDRMSVQILRPATVCGFSPRMRLDTMVNSFTMQALGREVIKFNGGDQYRPNIHIDDMTDLYLWMLARPELTGIYNAGFENLQIKEIARIVAIQVGARIVPVPSNDPRSYRINSDKLLATGFKPRKTVSDAIDELVGKYRSKELKDEPEWYSLASMPGAV